VYDLQTQIITHILSSKALSSGSLLSSPALYPPFGVKKNLSNEI